MRWVSAAMIGLVLVVGIGLAGCRNETAGNKASGETHVAATDPIAAGRYLSLIGGCNDCHTAGFDQTPSQIPESDWLTGSPVGYRGPWGTTYASNLRLFVNGITEDNWVVLARNRDQRPPMPWYGMHQMSEQDARAMYRFIKSLGPKGDPTPSWVPPDEEPTTPYIVFMPQMPAGAPKPEGQ